MPARRTLNWPAFRRALAGQAYSEQIAAALDDTAELAALGVPRWLRMALPDDVRQEVALAMLEYPDLSPAARRALIRWRCSRLRYEVWERTPRRAPSKPRNIQPSRLPIAAGYRTSASRHQAARMKLTPERRREIAALGQAALKARKEQQYGA